MPDGGLWTDSMKIGWDYARSAIERGLTATDGLRMYREAGYKIGDAAWGVLSRAAVDAKETGDRLMGLPGEPAIPGAVYTVVDLDLPTVYNVDVVVRYIDSTTDEEVDRAMHFGTNVEANWNDVRDGVADVLDKYGVLGGDGTFEVVSARFYTPQWAE